jgi:hypothetical protein
MTELIIPPRVRKAIVLLAKNKRPGDRVKFCEVQAHVMSWLLELGIVRKEIHRPFPGPLSHLYEGKRGPHDYIYQGGKDGN